MRKISKRKLSKKKYPKRKIDDEVFKQVKYEKKIYCVSIFYKNNKETHKNINKMPIII